MRAEISAKWEEAPVFLFLAIIMFEVQSRIVTKDSRATIDWTVLLALTPRLGVLLSSFFLHFAYLQFTLPILIGMTAVLLRQRQIAMLIEGLLYRP